MEMAPNTLNPVRDGRAVEHGKGQDLMRVQRDRLDSYEPAA
jgi:hypothetical protein